MAAVWYNVNTMFIQRNSKQVGKKIYHSVLLREGYRENGKVRMRTLLNLSSWPEEKIEGLKRVLAGESAFSLKEVSLRSGRSFGILWVLKTIADRLRISDALGEDRWGKLALVMIFARIINQGSKLAATRWAKGVAIKEVLDLTYFDEDDLYETLDWLDRNQEKVEDALFSARKKGKEVLFLYDVTSSYLEGEKNELAQFGYNRDGKRGKKQIVIGLLTDKEGYPVSVEVFSGNTQDTKTFESQIEKLSKRFGVKKVVLVGDKGMISSISVEQLKEKGFFYITSITKPEIESLIEKGTIQPSLFDSEIAEVEDEDGRYILRKNPIRQEEIKKNRNERVKKAEARLKEEAEGLSSSPRRDPAKALRRAIVLIDKLKLSQFIQVKLKGRVLSYHLDKEALIKAQALDGCYVIKTNVSKESLSTKDAHDRYKDLSLIEQAFRTMKTDLLEVRPIYHRKAPRTKAHVFVTMLAYAITSELKRLTLPLGFTTDLVISLLERIQISEVKLGKFSTKKIATPDADQAKVLSALGVKLPPNPDVLPTLTRKRQPKTVA